MATIFIAFKSINTNDAVSVRVVCVCVHHSGFLRRIDVFGFVVYCTEQHAAQNANCLPHLRSLK